MAFARPRGTADLLPGTVEKWQRVEAVARELGARFNYREIRTPIFEQTELFNRGVGETTDIVEKEMYTFLDKSGRSMTLRPEGTAGVVRAYVENKLFAEPEVGKFYYIGPMFRYERAMAGRQRQFHQFGIEAIGSADPALDAEVIALGWAFFREIGLADVSLEINSVGTPEIRAAFRDRLLSFLEPMKDELCDDCKRRMVRNPLRVLDCKTDQARFAEAPSILDHLDEACRDHFENVKAHLEAMGIPYTVNHRLVRGLDYYTHTAFEYKAAGIGAIDTIGGGGRYNGLVKAIGGPDQPGIGLGIGLERVMLLLEKQSAEAADESRIDVYLAVQGEEARRMAPRLLLELRRRGLSAETDYLGRRMKAQLKAADRLGAKFAALIGEEELAAGAVTLKDLATDGQESVPLAGFPERLADRIKNRAD